MHIFITHTAVFKFQPFHDLRVILPRLSLHQMIRNHVAILFNSIQAQQSPCSFLPLLSVHGEGGSRSGSKRNNYSMADVMWAPALIALPVDIYGSSVC